MLRHEIAYYEEGFNSDSQYLSFFCVICSVFKDFFCSFSAVSSLVK